MKTVARTGTLRSLGATFRPTGSAYRWSLELVRLRDRFGLVVQAQGDVTDQAQSYAWRFKLPLGNATMGPGLRRAEIHTGTALGPFGRIDLSFHPRMRIRVQRDVCPTTHALLFSYRERSGTLTGSFHFTPNAGDLPTVDVSRMKALAATDRATGARCPSIGPPPPHHPCRTPKNLNLTDAALHTRVFGYAGGGDLVVDTVEHVGPAVVERAIEAFTRHRVIIKQRTGLVVDASALSPLLSGSLILKATGGAVGVGSGSPCQRNRVDYVWTSGTLTANFDSGAIELTGAAIKATMRWRSR